MRSETPRILHDGGAALYRNEPICRSTSVTSLCRSHSWHFAIRGIPLLLLGTSTARHQPPLNRSPQSHFRNYNIGWDPILPVGPPHHALTRSQIPILVIGTPKSKNKSKNPLRHPLFIEPPGSPGSCQDWVGAVVLLRPGLYVFWIVILTPRGETPAKEPRRFKPIRHSLNLSLGLEAASHLC